MYPLFKAAAFVAGFTWGMARWAWETLWGLFLAFFAVGLIVAFSYWAMQS